MCQEYKPDSNEETKICKWEFDNFDFTKTESYIQLSSFDRGQNITVHADKQDGLSIEAFRDQWGTYITFTIGDKSQTIAQEDGTKSFLEGLIAALTKIKEITDFDTKSPVLTYQVCELCQGSGEVYLTCNYSGKLEKDLVKCKCQEKKVSDLKSEE